MASIHWVSCPLRSKLRACSRALWAEAKRSDAGRRAPSACCAAVGPPRFWLCTSCGEAAPPCVASLIAAVGGCCSRTVSPACGDAPPPCVAWFMAAVGGCCGFADSAAAADAAVLGSAAPIADVGGCCPVVVPTGPAVGPAPASRDANSFVRFSISVVHGPAAAVPSGRSTSAHAADNKETVFMTFSPDEGFEAHKAFEFRHFGTNLASERTFRSQIAAGAALTISAPNGRGRRASTH